MWLDRKLSTADAGRFKSTSFVGRHRSTPTMDFRIHARAFFASPWRGDLTKNGDLRSACRVGVESVLLILQRRGSRSGRRYV